MEEKRREGEIRLIRMFKNMLFAIPFKNIERQRLGNSSAKLVPHFNTIGSNTSSPYIRIMLNLMYFVSCYGIVMIGFVIDSEEFTKLAWKKIMK